MAEFAAAIAALQSKLQKQEQDARATKRLINDLSEMDGLPKPYPDADNEVAATLGSMRRDQFYGLPLARAIRQYMEMRRATGMGPATVNDIYNALCAGGFKFDAKNEANAKRGLYISLAKNSVTFHKLPGGTDETSVFGLLEWYPNAKGEESTRSKAEPAAPAKKKGPRMRLVDGKLVPIKQEGEPSEKET